MDVVMGMSIALMRPVRDPRESRGSPHPTRSPNAVRIVVRLGQIILSSTMFFVDFFKRRIFNKCSSKRKVTPTNCAVMNRIESDKYSEGILHNGRIEYLPSPVKSSADQNEYKVIRLQNGLEATLVSEINNLIDPSILDNSSNDINAEKSEVTECTEEDESGQSEGQSIAAVSLTVEVGTFSDPDDIQGLAHFLEHMIFMGSEKYPKENEFDAFIKSHGGSDNATTSDELTTFYFECPEIYLLKAMDIFAQLFTRPLLKWDAISRERESVESEYQSKASNDNVRKAQMLGVTAIEGNPARKFAAGNRVTLKDNITDEYLHSSLEEFRRKHYSSDRMKLAIKSRLPVATIEKWVVRCFSGIPKISPNQAVRFELPSEPFDRKKFCRLYKVIPVNDIMELNVTWILPSTKRKFKTKSLEYLAYVLIHDGEGSLQSFLREKGWIINIEPAPMSNKLYSLFKVIIVLTQDGLLQWDKVMTALFSYLKMMSKKGPSKRFYEEQKSLAEKGFRFQRALDARALVTTLSVAMTSLQPEYYLTGERLFFEYNPREIKNYLAKLTPCKANILLLTKANAEETDQEEDWYKIRYTSQSIPKRFLKDWKSVQPYPEFDYPPVNNFVTTDFSLIEHSLVTKYPVKIAESPLITVWYKGDDQFQLPVASVVIFMQSSKITKSPQSAVAVEVALKAVCHQVISTLIQAIASGNSVSMESVADGIALTVHGYSQTIGQIVDSVATGMKICTHKLNNSFLKTLKDQFTMSYYNFLLDPSYLAEEVLLVALRSQSHMTGELHKYIQQLDLESLNDLLSKLFDRVRFQALVQGNITSADATRIVEKFVGILAPAAPLISDDEMPLNRIKILPVGEKCFRVRSFSAEDKNCVTTVYFQYGPGSRAEYMALTLFSLTMEEPLFNQLRTIEQLGYSVSCTERETCGILGFSITVESQIDKFTVDHVQDRIDDFVVNFVKNFETMPEKQFLNTKQSLLALKMSADSSLSEEVSRNFAAITNRTYLFERLERDIEAIWSIDQSFVSAIAEELISPHELSYRKLVVQVVARDCNEETLLSPPNEIVYEFLSPDSAAEGYFVSDMDAWRNSLEEYLPHTITD